LFLLGYNNYRVFEKLPRTVVNHAFLYRLSVVAFLGLVREIEFNLIYKELKPHDDEPTSPKHFSPIT
jgi:hypothetical protein